MMWLKKYANSQLFVALLLLHYNVVHTNATNMDQLNNNQQQLRQQHQQTLVQAAVTSAQRQQHLHHVPTQSQHQLQSQQPLTSGIAAHPANGISSSISANSILHGSNTGHQHTETQALPSSSSSTSSLATLPQAQFANDKEAVMQEVLKHFHTDDDLNDPYQVLNELKRDTHVNTYQGPPPPPPFISTIPTSLSNHMAYNWNLYDRPYVGNNLPPPPITGLFSHIFNPFEAFPTPFPVTPRFMPIMSYPQPVYVPYPFIMSPEMFYQSYSTLPHLANDFEDSMSRGAGSSRRPTATQNPSSYPRNSPIYYVRLPPTPYMFLPSLGSSSTNIPGYPSMLPYQSLPPFPPFSSIYNVPINFLTNGKPTNIYQMSAPPNDVQNPLQFANIPSSFNTRPPPPPPPNAYRPPHNYFQVQPPTTSSNYAPYPASATSSSASSPSSPTTSATSSSSHQDSKLTSLKRPYYFNGRPEDIYILPNNFNSLYSSESSYY
ncbi:mucin-2 [Lucilia cuprina]|uniref:mucin-2 n=1 Tax=Lucilia cuprina TaxID=7375 RepID=UPI001F06D99B|nr:mucin-2 [Lucilia cuprina]XP_046805040.1 mucin-2 [Lucilia cuprina]